MQIRSSKYLVALAILLSTISAQAQDLPKCLPPYKVCLTGEQQKKVINSLKELKNIKESKAEVTYEEDIIIVRDWEDRVYINGGEKKPIKMKLRLGKTINRDMETQLPIKLSYREKPPDPMFRLRFRAQFGLLAPEIIKSIRDDKFRFFWDAGASLDFFHYETFNLAVMISAEGLGGGPGIDITKNFGIYAAPIVRFDGWGASLDIGTYFAFN